MSVSALGYTFLDRLLIGIGFIGAWLTQELLPGGIRIAARISSEGKPARITLRHFSDFLVLYEIFVMKEYAVEGTPKTVFDIGANVGFSALFFASRFPDAHIYAFEPDPITFKHLCENTAAFANVRPVNLAIGAHDALLPFYIYPGRSISSSLVRRLASQEEIMVPVRTVPSLMEEYGLDRIDLLKFDVEGSEIAVFEGLLDPRTVAQFIGEVHLDLIAEGSEWFEAYFRGRTVVRHDVSESRYILEVS